MPTRTAQARWEGKFKNGSGTMKFGNGAYEGRYSAGSRFENAEGTNPEELIAAAHAGCFSMALAVTLEHAGYSPTDIQTRADVQIQKVGEGFSITNILLSTMAQVPGVSADEFQKLAEITKKNCPVSKVLAGASIQLKAELKR
ncbi:MAG: OsmC family protein [Desulfobacteraceae bacterium]|nr:OsmC family protein [Desulfobacteraceae bacterium]